MECKGVYRGMRDKFFTSPFSCHQEDNISPEISQKIFPQSLWPKLSHIDTFSSTKALNACYLFVSSIVDNSNGERMWE